MAKLIANGRWYFLVPLVLSGLLCACKTTPPRTWSKPGANENDAVQALNQCQADQDLAMANKPKKGVDATWDMIRKEHIDNCMRSKGMHK